MNNGVEEANFDRLSPERRSALMSKVRGKETKPEVLVRKLLYHRGFRYRKNVNSLPGKPDIVLAKYRAIVFVHGCFWHQHPGCRKARRPKSRQSYWNEKLDRNIERDSLKIEQLKKSGWRVFIIWECELKPQCRQQILEALIEHIVSAE